MKNSSQIKKIVKDSYSQLVQTSGCCCQCKSKPVTNFAVQRQTQRTSYSQQEMQSAPDGANLGLGCGNPTAITSLKAGEIVLDLGCGAGFDVFLAANKVGKNGKVIGVDFSNDMLAKAKQLAKTGNFTNVEFKKGDIENLPITNDSVDVIISNCVINLSPNKKKVFQEAFRVLKPKGKLMVSDVVLLKVLPKKLKEDKDLLTGCISGAVLKTEYLELIKSSGFKKITIHHTTPSYLKNYAQSITVSAIK